MPDVNLTLQELAFLVSCVNAMSNYDGCIVPTASAQLKWSPDLHHIVGLQHLQADAEESFVRRDEAAQAAA